MVGVAPETAWEIYRQADCLYPESAVEAAIVRVAGDIARDIQDLNPLAICLLNGATVFFGKLLTRLPFPLEVDYVHATRYGNRTLGGDLHWVAGPNVVPHGRHILLVDDILDEGTTLAAIEQRYIAEGAASVRKTVLVEKQRTRRVPMTADYVGIRVPDRYLFGYGMDYKGYLRNAPGIFAVKGL